jgi:TRAP transporter TAXI family solute receptor
MSGLFRYSLRTGVCLALSVGALCSADCNRKAPAPKPPKPIIRLSTGPTGGGFYTFGEGLTQAYATSLPGVVVKTNPSAGAVANVEALQRGEADVAFTFADVAYLAYVGGLSAASQPYTRLRGIAILQLTPLHFVVRAGSGITTIQDLRNHRVSMGPPGTGTSLIVQLILDAFGVPLSTVHVEPLQFDEAANRLMEGTLDAMFDDAIYPAESVRVATKSGARLLPIVGPPIERLRHEYPFFRTAVIPRNSYPGVTEVIHTIGVDSLLICRRDLDESIVYDLTKHFFEALPALSSSLDALRFMDLDESPATPIPLHDGAARYYRERELLQ